MSRSAVRNRLTGRRRARDRAVSRSWLAAGLTFGAACLLLWLSVPPVPPQAEFAGVFYPAANAILHGHSPYSMSLHQLGIALGSSSIQAPDRARLSLAFIYPPPFALILAPLARLPYEVAARVYYGINAFLLLLTAVVTGYRLAPRPYRPLAASLIFAALVGFAPARATLASGQADIFVLSLVAIAIALMAPLGQRPGEGHGVHSVVAGICLGVAAAVKIYPAGLILVAAYRRDYRLVASAVASAGALIAVAVAVAGPAPLSDYIRVVQMGSHAQIVAFPYSFGLLALADRALTTTPFATPFLGLSTAAIKLLFAILAAGVLAAAATVIGRSGALTTADLAVTAAATLLVFPFLEINHLLFLMAILPAFVLVTAAGRGPAVAGLSITALATTGALGVLTVGSLATTGRSLAGMTLMAAAFVAITGTASLRTEPSTRQRWGTLMVAVSVVLLGSPAFQNMAAWWGVPMSQIHLLLGEGQLYLLAMLLVGLVLVHHRRADRFTASPKPGRALAWSQP
jgi:alpha-1,2-mannosyltransferase